MLVHDLGPVDPDKVTNTVDSLANERQLLPTLHITWGDSPDASLTDLLGGFPESAKVGRPTLTTDSFARAMLARALEEPGLIIIEGMPADERQLLLQAMQNLGGDGTLCLVELDGSVTEIHIHPQAELVLIGAGREIELGLTGTEAPQLSPLDAAPPDELSEPFVELDARRSHGWTFRLLWRPEELVIEVETGEGKRYFRPKPDHVIEDFIHPMQLPEISQPAGFTVKRYQPSESASLEVV